MTKNLDALPIVPLKSLAPVSSSQSTRQTLIEISDLTHELHDGFHVLTPDFQLLRLSQYFSPPIVRGLNADHQKWAGGRYMAALFGSALQDVLASGVATTHYGVAVFERGQVVATAS